MRQAAEAAETDDFNPAIKAATGDAGNVSLVFMNRGGGSDIDVQ